MWSPLLWLGINDTLRYSNITLLLSSRKVWGADFVSKNPQFSTPTSAADVWFRVQLSLYLIIIEMILVHVSFLIHSYCKYIKDISYRLHDWHAYSTNRALSKTPRSMTLTLTLKQKISFFGLCCHRGHSVSQTHLAFFRFFHIKLYFNGSFHIIQDLALPFYIHIHKMPQTHVSGTKYTCVNLVHCRKLNRSERKKYLLCYPREYQMQSNLIPKWAKSDKY